MFASLESLLFFFMQFLDSVAYFSVQCEKAVNDLPVLIQGLESHETYESL